MKWKGIEEASTNLGLQRLDGKLKYNFLLISKIHTKK